MYVCICTLYVCMYLGIFIFLILLLTLTEIYLFMYVCMYECLYVCIVSDVSCRWYTVNYSMAGQLVWGNKQGCEFAAGSCGGFIKSQWQKWVLVYLHTYLMLWPLANLDKIHYFLILCIYSSSIWWQNSSWRIGKFLVVYFSWLMIIFWIQHKIHHWISKVLMWHFNYTML